MPPLNKCPPSFSTPNLYFFTCKRPIVNVFWTVFSELWFGFIVKCICKHVYEITRFSLLAVRAYPGSFPVTTDNTSCFDASWLSINTTLLISCSTCSAKLLFFQKAMAVVNLIVISPGIWGCMLNPNILANSQSPLCFKVVYKRGVYFLELMVLV